jgi:hypothetical protein
VSVGGWQAYFLVRVLTGYRDSMHGTFTFPDPFLGACDCQTSWASAGHSIAKAFTPGIDRRSERAEAR